MTQPIQVVDLGRRSYRPVLDLQRALVRARIAGEIRDDLLLLVEHDPVVTLGRGTRETSLPISRTLLEARGFAVEEVERGGDVTVHAPGQLVGYPILDLSGHREDVHWYLRQIEEALICALASLGVDADRHPGYTGVWTDGRKIASIGIHVKRWVTLHGFALNVTTDLSAFDLVVPCGIPGVVMTSVELETGGRTHGRTEGRSGGRQEPLWNRARAETIRAFGDIFQREPVMTTLAEVDLMASARLD